jgi:hypothetical protein
MLSRPGVPTYRVPSCVLPVKNWSVARSYASPPGYARPPGTTYRAGRPVPASFRSSAAWTDGVGAGVGAGFPVCAAAGVATSRRARAA